MLFVSANWLAVGEIEPNQIKVISLWQMIAYKFTIHLNGLVMVYFAVHCDIRAFFIELDMARLEKDAI